MAPVPAPVPAVQASSGSDAAVSARQEADGAQAAGNDRADNDGKGDAASGDAAEGVAAPDVAAAGVPPIPGQKPNDVPEKEPPVAAKLLFGAVKTPAALASRAVGYYSRGCLSGGKALPIDGAAWQAMRLSRNRNWGHPKLVAMIERLATEAQKEDGWPGLLVGDMSQPRGGPMLTGHASHQIGLDADIWFTPMPSRRLSRRERENLSATSMIDGPLRVDPTAFTPSHVKVVKRAASYPEVERILVHPAIKKALCEAAGQDRAWLGKVRPYFGHYYHFHVRIGCPAGSDNCRKQTAPSGEDGCGKELDQWFVRLTRPPSKPKPKPPGYKPPPPKPPISLADLPTECKVVLGAGDSDVVENQAELVKSSIERSKHIIDISGKLRSRALAR
ncbi:MAG: penicillin-insensitive murein endopeptidase [Hyphomicrobiaceae bacterium]|nr:penicillin-insensitive murein endopeptidase [Hyphomicrobiaceae bacterium]